MLSRFYIFIIAGASLTLASCSLFESDKTPLDGERLGILENQTFLYSDYAATGYKIDLPSPIANRGWYQSGGNPEHIGMHFAGSDSFKKKWDESFGKGKSRGEYLTVSPVVANNVIYAMDVNAKVSAFDLNNGKEIWSRKLKPAFKAQKDISMKGAGLAVSNMQKKLFVTTGFGTVYSLDILDGKRVWKYDAEMPIRIAPTIGGGMVFVQTVDNTLIALDSKTGEELWSFKTSNEQTVIVGGASPTYSMEKDVVIAAFSNGEIRAFKASTGSPLWEYFLAPKLTTNLLSSISAIKSNPVISGDVVYAAGTGNMLVALDLRNGNVIWEKEIGTSNSLLLIKDYLFILDSDFQLLALNAKDGSIYWTSKLSAGKDLKEKVGAFAAGPVLVNNKLLVATSNGYVFAVSPYKGEVLASTEIGEEIEVSPIVTNGYTILTTSDADLIVYE